MIKLPIYLITDDDDNLKRLGIDAKPGAIPKMTVLHLRNDQVVGFWTEPNADKDGRRDVVVYTEFDSFLCPYSEELERKLISYIQPEKIPWHSFPG